MPNSAVAPLREWRSPDRAAPVTAYLETLLARHSALDDGEVASYIPELAHVDPSLFGICLVTVDGAFYEAGDARTPFTLQSMSKPLTYAMALERLGEEAVRSVIGVEPSGDAFNEISLTPESGAPVNPMINAGAIACAGLVAETTDDPAGVLLDSYSHYAGRPLELDEAVYLSESRTGHRNRAIAHLLRNFDVIAGDPEAALDLYFRQCSVIADCCDLAAIAATLANGGVNPLTGKRAVPENVVRSVLSVMTTCGMYDAAGEWLLSVGLPAKSGVSGGVLAVLPGRLGIGVFSPPVDANGNSVRAVAVCRDVSSDLALHLIRPGERPAPPVRATHTLANLRSKRVRRPDERMAIRTNADRTAIFELQGELGFTAAEALSRGATDRPDPVELVVVDLRRVVRANGAGLELLSSLAEYVQANGGQLAVAGWRLDDELPEAIEHNVFAELDAALEWCEDELLGCVDYKPPPREVALADHELLTGLTTHELERLLPLFGNIIVPAGTYLARHGEPANDVFLVMRGSLSVYAPAGERPGGRLTTLSAGMTFGELAYVERGPRSADVCADSEVYCRTLPYDVLDPLVAYEPVVFGKLMRNMTRVVVTALRVANADVSYLSL